VINNTASATTMADLLDTSALLGNVPNLLPGSATTLATPQDALAIVLHAAMTALSFRLVAIDEAAPAKEPETATSPGLLPEDWNKKGPDVYTFKYKHDQSSFTFLLKLVKLSGRVIVHGIAVEVSFVADIFCVY
jgi:proteasome inhibitor subunit 1 (PI31)